MAIPSNANWNPTVVINLTGSNGQAGTTLTSYANAKGLKIQFEFESHTSQAPASIQIVIYNISQTKAQQVQKEFVGISVSAGFQNRVGEIFAGSIVECTYGEKTDNFSSTLLRIYAIANDLAYGNARLSETLPAGWTHQDVIDRSAKAVAQYGVPMGQVLGVDTTSTKHPRPAVLVGMVRDILRESCLSLGATWTMNGGQLDVISTKHPGTGSSGVVIAPDTGMLGQAVQRLDGVTVSCLLNPAVKLNTTVKIKSKIISPTVNANALLPQSTYNISEYAKQLNASGDYRVIHIKATADTRGEDFQMTLTTVGVGQALNQTQLGLNYQ